MSPAIRPSPTTHIAAIALLGLYGAFAAWIVGSEGQRHRDELAAGARPMEPDPAEVASGPELPEETIVAQGPATKARKKSGIGPSFKTRPRTGDAPASKKARRKDAPPDPEPSRPEPAAPAAPTVAVAPAPKAPDPFWNEPDQQKFWDVKTLTIDGERELGRAVNRAILKLHAPLKVGTEPARLEKAAEPFLKARTRQALSYTLTVLDCPETNAFSHPGGYVYVCKGLFGLFAEDEDAALEFIVGHEIAHVDKMHMINALQDPLWKDLKIGTSPLICSILLPQDYADEQEFDADRWSWQMMNRAGRTKHQTLSFLRKWQARSLDQPFGNAPMTPDEEPAVDPLDNHLRAHVIPRTRLKALEPFVNPAPGPAPKPR